MFLTDNLSIQEVLFFPQMKPEKQDLDLTENEKIIYSILKNKKTMNLSELKTQAGLSNKKWDKGIKGLTKNRLARVEKIDDELYVSLL